MSIATSLNVYGAGSASATLVILSGTTLSAPLVQLGVSANSGTLTGYGTVEGSIANNSFVGPDGGSITVTGNYTQLSRGELNEQWDTTAILNVNGNVTLSGFLILNIDPKIPPKSGSTSTVMTFGGSLSGEFTTVTQHVSVKYEKNSVVAEYH